MENINMNRLLNYLKNCEIIIKYQIVFDKYFDLASLETLTDDDVDDIICDNEYESVIRLYEIINCTKINDKFKNFIISLNDPEIIRYCLRLSVSNDFSDEDIHFDFINALSESNPNTVRYAYGIASSKIFINKERGSDYVRMIGNCKEEVAPFLVDILHSEKYSSDERLYDFIQMSTTASEDYISEYMVELFKKEDSYIDVVPLSYISVLLCSKDRKQSLYAFNLLLRKDNCNIRDIAKIIASCDDEERAYNGFITAMDDEILNNENAYDIVYNAINNCDVKVKVKK